MGNRAYFFEDVVVLGNGANHMSIRPLLGLTSTKTLFSFSIGHSFISLHMYHSKLHGFFASLNLCILEWISHLLTTLRNTDLGKKKNTKYFTPDMFFF